MLRSVIAVGLSSVFAALVFRESLVARFYDWRLARDPALLIDWLEEPESTREGRAIADYLRSDVGGATLLDHLIGEVTAALPFFDPDTFSFGTVTFEDGARHLFATTRSLIQRSPFPDQDARRTVRSPVMGLMLAKAEQVVDRSFLLRRPGSPLVRLVRTSDVPSWTPGRSEDAGYQLLVIGGQARRVFPYARINARSRDARIALQQKRVIALLDLLLDERKSLLGRAGRSDIALPE